MTTRRTIGALMIAALALVAAACGSDSKSDSADSKKTTTTASSEDQSTTTAKPLSDEDYDAKVAEISAAITSAGADLCTLSASTSEGPPEPANSNQVKSAVNLYVTLLNAVANAFPAESAAKGEALKTAATTLQSDAEAAGYPVDFFSSEAATAALSGEGYDAAMTEYQTIYSATCVADTSTTVPAG